MQATDLKEAFRSLEAWGTARAWLGADPYEGLNARFANVLTLGGTAFGRRLLIQAVKTSPIDLRRALAIPPQYNAKAVALVAAGYARGASPAEIDDDQASTWLERLLGMNVASNRSELAWGYHFDFQSRVFFYSRGVPNTIATCFAGHAFLDAWERDGHDRWLVAARRTSNFLLRQMLVRPRAGSLYFRYVVGHDELIHNANALAVGFCLRSAAAVGAAHPDAVGGALACLLSAQRTDGSWPYGTTPALAWTDHYHTGYVLESLEYARRTGADCGDALTRGLAFYDRALFCRDGLTPRWTTTRVLPRDTHCIAQAIETHSAVCRWRPESLDRALAIARHGVKLARKEDGSFVFERRRYWTNRLALIRWSNAPMFRALGTLLAECARANKC